MSKRFFAFGCSYTRYAFATWADYIGVNFDEYYNYGRGGASNTYIMNKFIEANEYFKFNSNDCVMIMVSGIGRFSYAPKASDCSLEWNTPGDLYENYRATKSPILKPFIENMYSEDWAVYSSWIAIKAIKAILTANNVPHKFLMAIDNRNYLDIDGSKWGRHHPITLNKLTKEIYDLLDVKESLDEWMEKKNFDDKDYTCWKLENNRIDTHPTQRMHYDFVSETFPEFITSKSLDFFNEATQTFKSTTQHEQGSTFANELLFRYEKSYQVKLI